MRLYIGKILFHFYSAVQQLLFHISSLKVKNFQKSVLAWSHCHGRHHLPWRKENLTLFQIIIAEILLQRTKAETIESFYPNFLLKYTHWDELLRIPIEELENDLKPIGLSKQRSSRLKQLAQYMVIQNENLPASLDELQKIPFFGQYISNAIRLQVFQIPAPLLDVNMARVLERFFGKRKLSDIRFDPYLQNLAFKVVDHPQSKFLNWAILDFAAKICKVNKPVCERCLLSSSCKFNNNHLS